LDIPHAAGRRDRELGGRRGVDLNFAPSAASEDRQDRRRDPGAYAVSFLRQIRRTWLVCLRRRSQKSRRMGWGLFEHLTVRFPLPTPRITHPWTPRSMTRVSSGKSRVRESRMPGSVRATPNGRATRPRPKPAVGVFVSRRRARTSLRRLGVKRAHPRLERASGRWARSHAKITTSSKHCALRTR